MKQTIPILMLICLLFSSCFKSIDEDITDSIDIDAQILQEEKISEELESIDDNEVDELINSIMDFK